MWSSSKHDLLCPQPVSIASRASSLLSACLLYMACRAMYCLTIDAAAAAGFCISCTFLLGDLSYVS